MSAPSSVAAYAIVCPKNRIITWTCFRNRDLPWRQYRDEGRDGARLSDTELESYAALMIEQGYRLARVKICEIDEK